MEFPRIAKIFNELEGESGRLEMTDILAGLLKDANETEIDKLIYLIQGILAPPYEGLDLGIGEKFAIMSIASCSGYEKKDVERNYRKSGDLGLTAEDLLSKKKQTSLSASELELDDVFSTLLKIGKTSGQGSQDRKIKMLAELLNSSSPLEARYLIRFSLGRLRLGVGDPTILDALSVAYAGDKSLRDSLERAYNVCSDMGLVARRFYENPKSISKFKVQPFKPLMPALAERLSTPGEIIEKIGKCAIEAKYDGFRLQCHKKEGKVKLYSRKLEDMTHMFPDIVEEIGSIDAGEIIFEAEALAYNEAKDRFYSFQQTMHRRRKHGIKEASKEFPLRLFCFEIMFIDGDDLTETPYENRRERLERIFSKKGMLRRSHLTITDKVSVVKKVFKKALDEGLEGIIAKDLKAHYSAGKRGFEWIKLKKSYGKSVDTIDGIIVGYFLGKGHRAEFKFGGLLIAVKNPDQDSMETIAKIGSGFTEEEMELLQNMLYNERTSEPPVDLEFEVEPDYWVRPEHVVEVAFDEITKSPTHTCGRKDGKGYALRFPRMLSLREDKGMKEATTTDEVVEMYELQRDQK